MTDDLIRFKVEGTPRPQGSKRHVGNGRMVEMSKGVKPWRDSVSAAAVEAMHGREMLRRTPIRLMVTFYLMRPAGHRTPKGKFRKSAPAYPIGKPDFDKMIRAVCDAMTGIVFDDDSRIVSATIVKHYCDERPGCTVLVVPRNNDATVTVEGDA